MKMRTMPIPIPMSMSMSMSMPMRLPLPLPLPSSSLLARDAAGGFDDAPHRVDASRNRMALARRRRQAGNRAPPAAEAARVAPRARRESLRAPVLGAPRVVGGRETRTAAPSWRARARRRDAREHSDDDRAGRLREQPSAADCTVVEMRRDDEPAARRCRDGRASATQRGRTCRVFVRGRRFRASGPCPGAARHRAHTREREPM
ncbi:hypothetical protein WS71_11745 [Burkholderia mayonis]|uniref:Uncharacterized protein n=1 Tax=Burkholderia mayonis TaxID=1385591 RepID=A0A1B4FW58_9BURK|nr:hypothetical protein WS71_11745 [Burkholderia mayonis]KVE55403.1 hypothetical protein WS71_02840 [Burkholderia mayonis]